MAFTLIVCSMCISCTIFSSQALTPPPSFLFSLLLETPGYGFVLSQSGVIIHISRNHLISVYLITPYLFFTCKILNNKICLQVWPFRTCSDNSRTAKGFNSLWTVNVQPARRNLYSDINQRGLALLIRGLERGN